MKRLILLTGLLLLSYTIAQADDSVFSQLWEDLQANSSFHPLDNGTPGFFYDFKSHETMSGATTELWQYRYFSGDCGLVKSIQNSDHTLPVLGTNLHIGSYLIQFKPIHNAVTKLRLDQGILKYFVTGGWAGRDFSEHQFRYGFYTGFRAQFN